MTPDKAHRLTRIIKHRHALITMEVWRDEGATNTAYGPWCAAVTVEELQQEPRYVDRDDASAADQAHELAWILTRRQAGELTLGELSAYNATVGGALTGEALLSDLLSHGWALDGEPGQPLEALRVVPSEVYTSGWLWPKYDRAAALEKAGFPWAAGQKQRLLESIGIIAIEAVEDLAPHQGWVPVEIIEQWLREALGDGYGSRQIQLERKHGLIQVVGKDYEELKKTSTMGPLSMDQRLAIGWINHDRGVFRPSKSKEEDLDVVRRHKARELEESFRNWAWDSEEVKAKLQGIYNRRFRGFVQPTYSAEPLPLLRWSEKITLHPWQNAGARRVVANGGGLVAFDVGVGKTFTALAIVALSRQLGYAKRPVICVPNSIIWKWHKDVKLVMPDLRVAVIGSTRKRVTRGKNKGQWAAEPDTPKQRGQTWQRFQAGGYDLVLMTYTALQRTKVNDDEVMRYVLDTEAILREVALQKKRRKSKTKGEDNEDEELEREPGESDESWTIRQEAVFRNRVRQWVDDKLKIQKGWKYDEGVAWDDIGIDLLIVDEAQNTKNLYLPAPRDGGSPPKFMGSPGDGSKRAWQLDFRCAAVRRRATNGTGVCLLSATPAKNSPLEFYNLLQFIDHDIWARMGITNPEEFIDRYCKIDQSVTIDLEGEIATKAVCAGFKNLDELRGVLHRYGDFKNPEDLVKPDGSPALELPEPAVQLVSVDMEGYQAELYEELRADLKSALEDARRGAGAGQVLGVMVRMAMAALHPDLLAFTGEKRGEEWITKPASGKERWERSLTGEFNARSAKIEACATEVAATKDCGHIVFAENIAAHGFLLRMLVSEGIPQDRIAVLNGVTAKDTQKRQQIAQDFNGDPDAGLEPKYDVVIANQIAYEGIDLQRRTCAIHHLDLPWEPATLAQRNGRGVRQGNSLESIAIFYYIARNSADGYRFQQISGKRSWMVSLLKEADREINNPAAQQDMAGDVIAFLYGDDSEAAAEEVAKIRERFEAQQRADMAQAVARKLNQLVGLFQRARRMEAKGDENAEGLRLQGQQQLEQFLERTDPQAWPWHDFAREGMDTGMLVPASPKATAPLLIGRRYRFDYVRHDRSYDGSIKLRFEDALFESSRFFEPTSSPASLCQQQ